MALAESCREPQPTATDVPQILDEPGAPVIVFDHVQLAFDDKVVLKDISFTLIKGHTKIILGASGSGKSTDAEDHHRACCGPTAASSG